MAANNRKPVWLDENTHLTIKQYAKAIKKSMTDAASKLVLDHIGDLDDAGEAVAAVPQAEPVVQKATPAVPAAKPEAAPKKVEKAAAPKPKKERQHDGPRYLGGIWLV